MQPFTVSFEFFPPRDEQGRRNLVDKVATRLNALDPEFFSVTYGAGGSTRDGTRQTIAALLAAGMPAVPHLSLGTDQPDAVHALLDEYSNMGVQHIVALRGDQPSGLGSRRFENNAEALIRVINDHNPAQFGLFVAAYPETHPDAAGAEHDLTYFKRKVDAGANQAITQYFYNADAYEDFLERCAQHNIDIPIIPGIMPITNLDSLLRFSDGCGAEVPRWLQHRLADLRSDDQALIDYGVEVVTRLCDRLRQLGAPGLHFYTLNRWGATTRICENLSLTGA